MTTTWGAKSTGFTLSGGNLTCTTASVAGDVIGTTSHSFGQWYAEFTFSAALFGNGACGVCDQSFSPRSPPGIWYSGGAIGLAGDGTDIAVNGGLFGVTMANSGGQTVGMAFDIDNHLIWFSVAGGNWNGNPSANPATGVGGQLTNGTGSIGPNFSLYAELAGGTDHVVMNAGASSFAHAVPSGFLGWDVPVPFRQRRVALIC